MAEFDELQRELHQSRAAHEKARARAAAARERVERLNAKQRALDRVSDPDNARHARDRERLQGQIRQAEGALAGARVAVDSAGRREAAAAGVFAEAIVDPRRAISQLKDDIPILMMPVRLETRFKRDRDRAQLWVRVYPDDCSIDTFEAALSENEIINARIYWSSIWNAGGHVNRERGAWRGLAGSHGSGRAEWIVTNYKPLTPLTPPDKPVKASPDDVILTIATDDPPTDAEKNALVAFWSAVWLADDDADAVEDATDALAGAVGDAARAAELAGLYKPSNLSERPAAPKKKSDVAVTTSFVVFPKADDVDVKRQSWSRAATAELMPDRFVFIGYNGGDQEVFEIGNPVAWPLVVSPDPSAPEDQQLRQDANGELIFPDDMKWMVELDRAVAAGMGFRIDLSTTQASRGFDRVLVLGLRFSADAATAKSELETLFTHHRLGRSGFAIVPQGVPTNNTETGSSGFARTEDPDVSFDQLAQPALFTETANWLDKRDGQWLAEYLGIDPATLQKVRNSDGRDQADARAMNVALWPATLGYWMETMMSPVFTDGGVDQTRAFFNRFVSGRGAIPAVRIGKQPYGILPATAFSRMQWLTTDDRGAGDFLRRLYLVLSAMDADWRTMAGNVSYAGKAGDPHQMLLDIVGLHSGSVEYAQRYAESAEQLYNRLALDGLGGLLGFLIVGGLMQSAKDLLARLGYTGDENPDMLRKFFLGSHNALSGPVIDDRPLSEVDAIRAYTTDGRNYLQWLIDAANTSISAVYAQEGFVDDKPPRALLYLMLRHALQLGYHDASLRLHQSFGLLDAGAVKAARRDDPFIHVREQPKAFESRYEVLYKTESVITGSPTATVGEYIGKSLGTLMLARYLREQVAALGRLKDASTARLERAFAEHVDCCSYRLDAWLQGLVHVQLARMRNITEQTTPATSVTGGAASTPRTGIYLGAYAWLEELRPDNRVLQSAQLPPDLAEDFTDPDAPPLRIDGTNQGFIHAPSLNQGVAAAVLRNGYLANAGSASPQTLAVNVTSERVRTALGMLEGIRGGQSLGALLGYQFERGLHDRSGFGVEVDEFIFKFRREFPLAANRIASTRRDEDTLAIDSVEARNVIDGLAFVNHMRSTGATAYPFGKPRLPPPASLSPGQLAAINGEAERLVETFDAVADLAMSEGVYQAVLGNYDRVASTLDAYSKGNFPPEPLIARTPFEGVGLTHRVGLHFEPGIDPTVSPIAGVAPTPRSLGEPAVNQWLASILPPFDTVGCLVDFRDGANAEATQEIFLTDLEVQPLDVLRLLRDDTGSESLTELDERIMSRVAGAARPDGAITIRYMDTDTAPISIFELLPLARHLLRLLGAARPLKPTDLSLSNEAKREDDADVFADDQRIVLVRDALSALRTDLDDFATNELEGPLSDVVANRAVLLANADTWIDSVTSLFPRAAAFAMPQSGWGFAYDFRARAFRAILTKAGDLLDRWQTRLDDFQNVVGEYDALPGTATDEERLQLLTRAERLVSTETIAPFPATRADYRTALDTKRNDFAAKRNSFLAIRDTTRTRISLLLADVAARLPVDAFEFPPLSVAEEENQLIAFAQDALSTTRLLVRECDRRITAAEDLLADHAAAASNGAKVKALQAAAKALLGEDFVIVPELALTAAQAAELTAASAGSASLLDYLTNTVKTELPVDTWMYGVARVRARVRDWEQIVMHAGAFRPNDEPVLTPLQIPFAAGDSWLALEFPPDMKLDTERLLYTAHFSTPFDATARQCGLLLDEWTEVIPAAETTTAIAMHYDRPNNEAAQAMLLVTPSAFRGAWQWNDLVDALHETLDLAKRRAVEPVHVDGTRYAQFLPATIMAVTMRQLTISANLSLNNNLIAQVAPND